MSRFLAVPLLIGCLCIPAIAQTSEESPGAMFALDVLIAEFNLADAKGEITPDKIKELERQGALRSQIHVHLATLENQPASVQLGQRVPMPIGRTMRGGSREGGPSFATTYNTENLGTMVRAIGRLHEGAIIVELTVETTQRAPEAAKPDSDAAAEVTYPKIASLNTKTTLRLEPGKQLLVEGVQAISPEESLRQVLLVTGNIIAPAPQDAKAAAAGLPPAAKQVHTEILRLQSLNASVAGRLLESMFREYELWFYAVDDANSLILRGAPEHVAEVQAVLGELDHVKASPANVPAGPAP
jgi:type II secretory pathway component GspD/PulD (secretin)